MFVLLYPPKRVCILPHAPHRQRSSKYMEGCTEMQPKFLFLSSFFLIKNIITLLIFMNRKKAGWAAWSRHSTERNTSGCRQAGLPICFSQWRRASSWASYCRSEVPHCDFLLLLCSSANRVASIQHHMDSQHRNQLLRVCVPPHPPPQTLLPSCTWLSTFTVRCLIQQKV